MYNIYIHIIILVFCCFREWCFHGKWQEPFTFVPRYMFYILTELLKNSVRATVEHAAGQEMGPVTLVVGAPR